MGRIQELNSRSPSPRSPAPSRGRKSGWPPPAAARATVVVENWPDGELATDGELAWRTGQVLTLRHLLWEARGEPGAMRQPPPSHPCPGQGDGGCSMIKLASPSAPGTMLALLDSSRQRFPTPTRPTTPSRPDREVTSNSA